MIRRLSTLASAISLVLPILTCVPLARGEPSTHLVFWSRTGHDYFVGNGSHGTLMLGRQLHMRGDLRLEYIDMEVLVDAGLMARGDRAWMDRCGFALYTDRLYPLNVLDVLDVLGGGRSPLDNCVASVPAWVLCRMVMSALHMPAGTMYFSTK
jgi:hypothetical protein